MRASVAVTVLGTMWAAAVIVQTHAQPPRAPAGQPAMVDFEADVQPLFELYCLECHSSDKRKGGLSLAAYADVLEGGRSGPAIRPGNVAGSLLVHRVAGETEPQMPLDELPLGDAELAVLRRWIEQGARPHPAAPPAPPPWEAPLALERPSLPPIVWNAWSEPLDRLVADYLVRNGTAEPSLVSDAAFARRAYLDVWGLLPPPDALQEFLRDRSPDKRTRLVQRLLADGRNYAEGWMSLWNDLLRNEDGVTYFSEDAGRQSITAWLFGALEANLPYDTFVRRLLDPREPGDPDGFLIGVNWRGETSAAVTPWMQASQNTAQVFLGVNMKCNACHDSFVNRWKLKDAYALAAYFSPDPALQLFRCDVARDEFTGPEFLFPELNRVPASMALPDRRAAAAEIFTDPANGRMPRTVVNRIWTRLLGRGIVPDSDEMDGKPWSPEVLDWLAADFAAGGYDVKRLIATIMASRAYQMPAVARQAEPAPRNYVFTGPEVRRLTAEQFADAVGTLTGEWSVYYPPAPRRSGPRPPTESDAAVAGRYGREWRAASSALTRALGRPIRDQVTSSRADRATTLQALELVNGEILTRWLNRGARRLLKDVPAEPPSVFNAAVAGRYASARSFDVDVAGVSRLWLIATDTGSNAPERVRPVWSGAELVAADGSIVPLTTLRPVDAAGFERQASADGAIEVRTPSRLVYDLAGRDVRRFRGQVDLANQRSEIGSTLNPQVRFFVFTAEPNMERLVPPAPGAPLPPPAPIGGAAEAVDRLFWQALGRPPSPEERRDAEAALAGQAPGGPPSPEALADLLWVLLMKPEFQLIY